MAGNKELELYIHIPFCIKKCNYCDFVSFAGMQQLYDRYIDRLCEEIKFTSQLYKDHEILSIYIGGGTPSVLTAMQISRIFDSLYRYYDIKGTKEKKKGLFLQKKLRAKTEFSIEVNPGTVDRDKLKVYKNAGINRISIGLQSSSDSELSALGRIHTFEDFVRSFDSAREAAFDNINIDTMQAIPGQTLGQWKKNLSVIASFRPEHISAYSLIIEEGTVLKKMYDENKLELPDEDTEREIYYYTKEFLEKCGYRRYEISNYALEGYECIHNTGYWKRKNYLGLGLNSSSMIDNVRWKNTADMNKYLDSSNAFLTDIIEDREELDYKSQMEEFVFLGLRLSEGISKKNFFELFSRDFDHTYGHVADKLRADGLLTVEGDKVRLTEKGIDLSNVVFAEFLF